jgi:Trk K+ transport system NAD-binding subunit
VLVIGLGRFGSALAETLMELGHDVLGVDADPKIVQDHADDLTHVLEADATDIEVLRQLGAGEFGRAVVAIGTDLEASILTASVLGELGVPDIWAKAITVAHGRILERVGAHHVVYPEHDMGRRVAHLLTGRMIEFVQLDEGFALVELPGRQPGPVPLRHHRGQHQARGRLVHLRDPGHRARPQRHHRRGRRDAPGPGLRQPRLSGGRSVSPAGATRSASPGTGRPPLTAGRRRCGGRRRSRAAPGPRRPARSGSGCRRPARRRWC